MASKAIVKRMQQSGDLVGLMEVLRYLPDAELRAAAAQALGELLDFDAIENLIRSTLLDPDLAVQQASRQALDQILGNRAQGVIDSYPVDTSEKETWLRPVSESALLYSADDADDDDDEEEDEDEDDEDDEEDYEDDEEDDDVDEEIDEEEEAGEEDEETYRQEEDIVATAETGGWIGNDLSALVTILRSEGSVPLRVRAARALGKKSKIDMKAVDALAATALWSDSPSVRAAATKALVRIFGDEEADEMLHTYRAANGSTGWGDDFYKDDVREDLEEGDPVEEENEDAELAESEPVQPKNEGERLATPSPLPYSGHPPVVQDEGGGNWVLLVLVVIIGIVLVALAFYLGIFK